MDTEKCLRDEFAMAALTGLLSGQSALNISSEVICIVYKIADAMLEARKVSE